MSLIRRGFELGIASIVLSLIAMSLAFKASVLSGLLTYVAYALVPVAVWVAVKRERNVYLRWASVVVNAAYVIWNAVLWIRFLRHGE